MLCEVILYYSLSLIKLSRCKIISWLNDCTVRPRFWGLGTPRSCSPWKVDSASTVVFSVGWNT
uniref:Uncharacterized protein n=1 Tax=Anguilla anguilla TaxID=7936 RepID=A0A0E9R0R6_ANGAN